MSVPNLESRPGRWRPRVADCALLPGTLWLLALFVVPIVTIAVVSMGQTDILGRPQVGWNPGNYRYVFDPLFIPVMLRTVAYAACVTALCVVLGYPVAYFAARYAGRFRYLILGVAVMPWFVDYLVRIYAWMQILGSDGPLVRALRASGFDLEPGAQFIGNAGAVITSLTYDMLPMMIMTIFLAVSKIDNAHIEAARDLYASPRSAFFRVILPLSASGVATGSVLVFLAAAGDFANAQLLGGPDNGMLGNIIQMQFTGAVSLPTGAGLTMLLLVAMLLLTTTVALIRRFRSAA